MFIFTDCFIVKSIKKILIGSEVIAAFMMSLSVFLVIIGSFWSFNVVKVSILKVNFLKKTFFSTKLPD